MWTFKLSDLRQRLIGLGVDVSWYELAGDYILKAIEFMSRWTNAGETCDKIDDDEDPHIAWISGLERPPMGKYAIRCGIHGVLSGGEEVLHVQHLVKARNGTDMSGIDAAALDTLAALLKTAWGNFLNNTASGASASAKTYLTNSLSYDEIRLSLVEYQTAPTKPTVHVATRYYAWGTPIACTGSSTTPYETAMVLTLCGATRDRRYRGRVYLGPFAPASLGNDGKWASNPILGVSKGFGQLWVDGVHSATDYDVVIMSAHSRAGHQAAGAYLAPEAEGVGAVYSGVIPDVQRSRRKNLAEAKVLQWGTAPG